MHAANQNVAPITVGTPALDQYGNHGFVAEIRAPAGKSFVLSSMTPVRDEYVICWPSSAVKGFSELPDSIAAPFFERARRANLPHVVDVAEQVAKARQATAERHAAAEIARQEAARAKAAFDAQAAEKMPAWAKAVIVAELIEDRSDIMTDYFGSTTRRTVILAFSKHTRDLFPELRKAAAHFPETAHLADAPESAEHREKWSMGAGYYLKTGSRHGSGWQVRKLRFYGESRNLPVAEWALAAPETVVAETVSTTAETATSGMRIERHTHSKKGFEMHICILPDRVERDEFDRLRDRAQSLGGWYSRPWGRTPGGFAFKRESAAIEFAGQEPAPAPTTAATVKVAAPREPIGDKLRSMADAMQAEIDGKFANRLTNTPKRQRQAGEARNDGYRLQRTQAGLRALAAAHDAGTVPAELLSVRTKKAVFELVATVVERNGGYYDYGRDTGKPALSTPAAVALWRMMETKPAGADTSDDLRRKIERLQFASIPGFFPTPRPVLERLSDYLDCPEGAFDFLEPEAGSGAILDFMRERFPAAELSAYERHASLREILHLKGYTLTGSDFMESEAAPAFDRIMMNPPFENGQDIDHVRHAFAMLRDGGVLVSVMSPGPFYRSDRKALAFREWFESEDGEMRPLPDGSFKASGTGTGSVFIVMHRGT